MIGDSDNDAGGGVDSDDVYNGRAEPVLVSLSDLYSIDKISVGDSRFFSCSVYTVY